MSLETKENTLGCASKSRVTLHVRSSMFKCLEVHVYTSHLATLSALPSVSVATPQIWLLSTYHLPLIFSKKYSHCKLATCPVYSSTPTCMVPTNASHMYIPLTSWTQRYTTPNYRRRLSESVRSWRCNNQEGKFTCYASDLPQLNGNPVSTECQCYCKSTRRHSRARKEIQKQDLPYHCGPSVCHLQLLDDR